MEKLKLNDLLRSGFAGAVFLLVTVAAFYDPGQLSDKCKDMIGAIAALAVAVGLTIGAVIYAVHRALPYPLLYLFFKTINCRQESTLDLDILRWKNSMITNSLQPNLRDWADQVHFLYCVTWASAAALILGNAFEWKQRPAHCATEWLLVICAVSALVHHFRYQRWERRVFQKDADLAACETGGGAV